MHTSGMDVVEALVRCGGFADRRTMLRLTSRRRLEAGLVRGDVVRLARDRYALPVADAAAAAAHAHRGVVSHLSAAVWWGWEVALPPARPHVTVPKHRRLRTSPAHLHWVDLHAWEIDDGVTTPERTLVDCLRALPFDDGLAVADSALRHGFGQDRLRALARSAQGPGSTRVRRVADAASGLAANPFESVLRAQALEVGLKVEPQVWVEGVRPDLVDVTRNLVLEADSFSWHGSRAALRRDCRRYNRLVIAGWVVLRFAWEDVMHERDHTRSVLAAVAAHPGWTERPRKERSAA